MTFREIDIVMRGVSARERRTHNANAWMAHTMAYLSSYAPEKSRDFTKLEKLQDRGRGGSKSQPQQNWRQQLAKVQGWVKRR